MIFFDEDGSNSEVYGFIGDRYKLYRQYLEQLGFQKVGSGNTRAAYCRKNIIIKIPRNFQGMIDNQKEAQAWKKYYPNRHKYEYAWAPCRLLPNDCLMMVKVSPIKFDELPEWGYYIDCQQLGKYKNQIVAFDFANNV